MFDSGLPLMAAALHPHMVSPALCSALLRSATATAAAVVATRLAQP
jgi:hypothetical protein